MRHLKKIWLALVLLVSIHVSFCQPGNVNYYKTRQRYYLLMTDSLNGIPSDTFNLHTPYAINNTWNLYPWIASKGDITYLWSVVQQRWIATNIPLISTVSVINDSTIQICNNNGCDTVNFNITTNVITNVSIISDSTLLVCVNNSCDTVTFNITQPPVQTVSILNDSTIIVCDANGCDTLHINSPPGITNVSIINDSTIQVCNINSCDTIIFSSPPTVTILNDSTIQVCNATGSCDTIIISSPVDITIINDSTIQVCGSNIDGPELITNGDFNGSATGWELGALWNYGSGNIVHSFGSTQATAQAGGLVQGASYKVTADIGGSTGTVDVKLDAGTSQTYAGGAGAITFTGTWNNGNNYKIVFLPSTDFDGTITNVSVKQILPNCDTIQIQPAFFLDTIHIFVESPLHARNDSTFYITRASKLDSGFLSDSDFTYFWHKVDSIYTHPSPGGVDSFFYKNGDTTVLWYLNDVVADGIVSGGQVVFSGTPLVYNVTPAVYRINGVRYTSPGTQLTINNFDLSYPRTDVFYVDTSGNAGYLPGIAATPNLKPSINRAWQLELTSIDFPAGGLPGLDTVIVFDQNIAAPTEWTPITSGGTTINANDLSSPWRGTKDLDVTNINNASFISFNYGTTFDLSPFQSLNGFIKLKTPLPSTSTIRLVWQTSGSTVSQMRIIPLNGSNTTTYQAFSLPLNNFGLASNVVTNLRLQYVNTSGNNFYLGFLMDYVYLQSGLAPTPQGANALVRVSRAAGKDSVMGTYQDGSISYQFKDSAGAAPVTITADNGLTDSVNRIILGGTLYKTTTIDAASFSLIIPGTINGNVLDVSNSNNNNVPAIKGTSTGTSGTGVWGSATQNGAGVTGTGVNGVGLLGTSTANYALSAIGLLGSNIGANNVSTNTATEISTFYRNVASGVGANGVGGIINISIEDDGGNPALANQFISKFTNATHATRTSQFSLTGVNSAVTADLAYFNGNGFVLIPGLGNPTFTLQANNVNSRAIYGHVTGSGAGVTGDAGANGIGVQGTGTTGTGVQGTSDSGNGVEGNSTSGVPVVATGVPTSTNTVTEVLRISKSTTGTSANGIGGSIDFRIKTDNSNTRLANQIKSILTDATDATRTSQLDITGVNSASTTTIMSAHGSGSVDIGDAGNVSTSIRLKVNATGSSGQIGILSLSDAAAAIVGTATGNAVGGAFNTSSSGTNDINNIVSLTRTSTGTAAAGIGARIQYSVQANDGGTYPSNGLISKWTDATLATRTSQFIITGVNSAATGNVLVISGDGSTQMPKYGSGAATFDASGNITSVSDVRLKDVQGDYDGGLRELMNVTPIIYKWNEKSGMEREHNYIGFSAQNIQSALGNDAIGINREGYLSIQDRAILATLTNAVKEQQKEIEDLKHKVFLLENK